MKEFTLTSAPVEFIDTLSIFHGEVNNIYRSGLKLTPDGNIEGMSSSFLVEESQKKMKSRMDFATVSELFSKTIQPKTKDAGYSIQRFSTMGSRDVELVNIVYLLNGDSTQFHNVLFAAIFPSESGDKTAPSAFYRFKSEEPSDNKRPLLQIDNSGAALLVKSASGSGIIVNDETSAATAVWYTDRPYKGPKCQTQMPIEADSIALEEVK